MKPLTVEVEISAGRIIAREPEKLPLQGTGLLTITSAATDAPAPNRGQRVQLPLIRGDGRRIINPAPAELDDSFWGD